MTRVLQYTQLNKQIIFSFSSLFFLKNEDRRTEGCRRFLLPLNGMQCVQEMIDKKFTMCYNRQ